MDSPSSAEVDQRVVFEGDETEEFWNLLGGNKPYPQVEYPPRITIKNKLFHCNEGTIPDIILSYILQ